MEFQHTGGNAPPEVIEYLVWEHFHRPPEEIGPRRIMEFLTVHPVVEKMKHG